MFYSGGTFLRASGSWGMPVLLFIGMHYEVVYVCDNTCELECSQWMIQVDLDTFSRKLRHTHTHTHKHRSIFWTPVLDLFMLYQDELCRLSLGLPGPGQACPAVNFLAIIRYIYTVYL